MHMQNELLSVPVAVGAVGICGCWIGIVCRKLARKAAEINFALMGILGAFIFAAQMVNFPTMPGTSGHMIGAVLLAIILGPHLGMIVLTSVVVVQCLIYQDGGVLALGCNILNIAIVPSYVGYFIYRLISRNSPNNLRIYIASIAACVISLECGAILVSLQIGLSNVLTVPFYGFLTTMLGVYLIGGVIEGLITVAVVGYLVQVRPQVITARLDASMSAKVSLRGVCLTLLAATLLTAGGLSLLASDKPDGLEWCYAERPDQEHFEPIVENQSPAVATMDDFQTKFSLMPDYTVRTAQLGNTNHESSTASGWTSLAGVSGAIVTMLLIGVSASLIRRKTGNEESKACTMHT